MTRVRAYTAAQVRAAEAPLLAAGEPLMDRAAAALAAVLRAELPPVGRVLVVAGRGDNGGDALLAGATLASAGVHVDVLLTADAAHPRGLAAARDAGARVVSLDEAVAGPDYALIVDGIVGIGSSADPTLRGGAREAVARLLPAVRAGRSRVVAVDIPSGVQPDDGTVGDDVVLPAAVTVTFGAVKAGLVCAEGARRAGRIVLVDLGLRLPEDEAVATGDVDLFDGAR
ncbi:MULTISPECIES: NAD(P)H-hydrate epimerase [Microbacterium]|uniref:NAD(P)H-hydrate epimerase n=1 Tax=Microbacterium TaxID=33882 RepID=UPI00214CF9C0|nr:MULTISPECIES: NAD(P)H-hydrate epimerase [unclassified Microbacterium]MCR2814133.1 NAD(P)H-hydrate epimerase [Microbacterium sp. zg.Y1084]MDL5488000.1 NAD(P)H-hydrate epimerase [Microbacterium sp. zg-Y1211]